MGYENPSILNAPDEPSGNDHGSGSSRDPPPSDDTHRAEGDNSQLSRLESELPSISTTTLPRSEANANTTTEPVAGNGGAVPSPMTNFPARFGIQSFQETIPTNTDNNAAVSVHRIATPSTQAYLFPAGYGLPNSLVVSAPPPPLPMVSPSFRNTLSPSPNYLILGNLTSPAIGRGMIHRYTYQRLSFSSSSGEFRGFPNVGPRLIPHGSTPQFFFRGLQRSPPVAVRSALRTGMVDPFPFTVTPRGPQTVGFHLPDTGRGPPNAAFLTASSSIARGGLPSNVFLYRSHTARASPSFQRGPRPPQRSRGRSSPQMRLGTHRPTSPVPQTRGRTRTVPYLQHRRRQGLRISPPRDRIRWEDPDQTTKCCGNKCFLCKRDFCCEPVTSSIFRRVDEWPCIAVLPCKHTFHDRCFRLATTPEEQSTQQPACPACAAEAGEETC